MIKKCNVCGKEFKTTDGRRQICDKCNSPLAVQRQKEYLRQYVKKRRETDEEFRQHLIKMSATSAAKKKEARMAECAVEIVKLGHDVKAIAEYLDKNFRLKHKDGGDKEKK